jgi:hypothetical protein
LRQHHAIGKNDTGFEQPVAIFVLETHDPVRAIGELLFHLVVGTRRIRDVQAPLFVEVRDDGPIDERRPGNALDLEAGRHGELGLRWRSALLRLGKHEAD